MLRAAAEDTELWACSGENLQAICVHTCCGHVRQMSLFLGAESRVSQIWDSFIIKGMIVGKIPIGITDGCHHEHFIGFFFIVCWPNCVFIVHAGSHSNQWQCHGYSSWHFLVAGTLKTLPWPHSPFPSLPFPSLFCHSLKSQSSSSSQQPSLQFLSHHLSLASPILPFPSPSAFPSGFLLILLSFCLSDLFWPSSALSASHALPALVHCFTVGLIKQPCIYRALCPPFPPLFSV